MIVEKIDPNRCGNAKLLLQIFVQTVKCVDFIVDRLFKVLLVVFAAAAMLCVHTHAHTHTRTHTLAHAHTHLASTHAAHASSAYGRQSLCCTPFSSSLLFLSRERNSLFLSMFIFSLSALDTSSQLPYCCSFSCSSVSLQLLLLFCFLLLWHQCCCRLTFKYSI